MLKFFQAIKSIKKLKAIEPDQKWLKILKMHFRQELPAQLIRDSYFNKNRLALTLTSFALILALGGGGLINSAQAAFPGDVLYPIKIFGERVQEALTVSQESKINLALKFAEKRLEEAEKMDQQNSGQAVAGAEENFQKAETALKNIAKKNKNGEEFKNLEKTVDRLKKLSERKNQLAKKLPKRLPNLTKVTVEKDEDKIVVTFDSDENSSGATGTKRIIELLTDGAGPLKAEGVRKKLEQ